jgi:hypothetical protein
MLSLSLVFWIFIIMFALIGAMRGWAKELRVTFSMILVLFIIQLTAKHVPFSSSNTARPFYFWLLLVVVFALLGYHIPTGGKVAPPRSQLQNWLLGCIIGACNGYLLVGTVWYYLDMAGYPFASISAPADRSIIAWLPPAWLNVPIAVAVAFTIVVIVFI